MTDGSWQDPVFFAVAFRGADRIWIIDADAEVGEVLEDGLKVCFQAFDALYLTSSELVDERRARCTSQGEVLSRNQAQRSPM